MENDKGNEQFYLTCKQWILVRRRLPNRCVTNRKCNYLGLHRLGYTMI